MTVNSHAIWHTLFVLATITSSAHSSVVGEDGVIRSYWIDVMGFSIDPDQPLKSYRQEGKVAGSVGAGLGIGTLGEDRPISVSLRPLYKTERLLVEVTLTDKDSGEVSEDEIDLTDLDSESLELTRDQDGRVYWLKIEPSVTLQDPRPKPLSEATERLYDMRFKGSRVLLNDERYIGRMAASGSDFFSLNISDLASIEFSLRQLKDAKPSGKLQNGTLSLSNPSGEDFVEITNVSNGSDGLTSKNTPYQVWVRWEPPTTTFKAKRAELEELRKKVVAGEFDGQPGLLKRIDEELSRQPGPRVVGSGARRASTRDLANP